MQTSAHTDAKLKCNHCTPMLLLQGLHCMLHIFGQSLWWRDHSRAGRVLSPQLVLRMKLHPQNYTCVVMLSSNNNNELGVSLWIYKYQIKYPTNISSYTAYPVNNTHTVHNPQKLFRTYPIITWGMDKLKRSEDRWDGYYVTTQASLCLCHVRRSGSLVSTALLSQ